MCVNAKTDTERARPRFLFSVGHPGPTRTISVASAFRIHSSATSSGLSAVASFQRDESYSTDAIREKSNYFRSPDERIADDWAAYDAVSVNGNVMPNALA